MKLSVMSWSSAACGASVVFLGGMYRLAMCLCSERFILVTLSSVSCVLMLFEALSGVH